MKGKSVSSKTPLSVADARKKILAKLERAGRRGAPRGGLGFTSTAPYATIEALERALFELLQEGEIIQVFTRPVPRFFTLQEAPQVERVAEKILARAEKKTGRLLTLSDLERALSVVEKPLAEKAADALVKKADLVRLRYQAKDVYTHAENLREALRGNRGSAADPILEPSGLHAPENGSVNTESGQKEVGNRSKSRSTSGDASLTEANGAGPGSETPARTKPQKSVAPSAPDLFDMGSRPEATVGTTSAIDRAAIADAYAHLVSETGFPDVEITELSHASRRPLDLLKAHLLRENAEGRAIFSFGDWSLASASTREGAIELRGEPYLLVRFPSVSGLS